MKTIIQILTALMFICSVNSLTSYAQKPEDFFKIIVVDEQTGRGVPLVELKTTNDIRYYTDNNGIIAFYEPGLMDQEVYFHIKSHGYKYPNDGFGYRGTSLFISKSDSALIKIKRINIAERLYRITGQGLYHHSILIGHPVPIKQPVLNGKVSGQDTFIETLYKGKLYWLWGDTDRPSYPLGNFSTSGATSELPKKGGLDPSVGIDLTYFIDSNGFSKPMCPIPGPGPVWIHWLVNIIDEQGNERLVGSYNRIKTLEEVYERGIVIFDDSAKIFKPIIGFDLDTPLFPEGHPLRVTVNGKEYLYFSFSTPYNTRVRADLKHITNPESYEAFTCLVAGNQYNKSFSKLDRDPDGDLIYSWKANTKPIKYNQQDELIKSGKIQLEEAWLHLQDFVTGTSVISHAGSVFWNKFRRRWIMIFHEKGGTSNLGEVWYAEGDTPSGPWVYTRKIVTHDKYSFYNVGQHPIFDQDKGRIIYFEGTYTQSFSNSPFATPRYDYNQIMYRLDLKDPRLYLPAPVYSLLDSEGNRTYMMRDAIDSLNLWENINGIPFFAVPENRKLNKLVPVYLDKTSANHRLQTEFKETEKKSENLLFYALLSSLDKQEQICEIWECEADGYPINLEITMTENNINVSIEEESLLVTKVDFANDTIVLNVKDTFDESDYIITASMLEGKMNGNIVEVGTEEILHWEGERIDFLWKHPVSQAVVPLYEYQNEDGEYYYSTDSELPKMKRSQNPICHVWRNPSKTLILDFEAKPVPFVK